MRVHDRRPGGGAGLDRCQLRRGDERRDRIRARRGRDVRAALQHGAGRVRRNRPARRRRAAGADRRAPQVDRLAGGPAGPGQLGPPPAEVREGHAPRLPAGARGAGPGGGSGLARGRASPGFPAVRTVDVMGELGGFLRLHRVGFDKRDPQDRIHDYKQYFGLQPEDELRRQGGRCMDCGVPFCHEGCPLGNLIPDWNDLVYRGDWRAAIDQLHATNNFPEFTGLICPAPCESACVLDINDDPVTIEQIELAIVTRGFEEGWIRPDPPDRRSGKTVGVVGSGPAGLAVAAELNKSGHTVTVYERDEGPGGLMRFGVPDAKLPKGVIDRRAALLEAEGVRFEYGADVGVTVTAAELGDRHDALVVAIGSRVHRDVEVEGRELDGVHFAMDYLYQRNRFVAAQEGRPTRAPEPGT